MSNRQTRPLEVVFLMLLASCGRVESKADDSVTAKLPHATGAPQQPHQSQGAAALVRPASVPESLPADVKPAEVKAGALSRYTSLDLKSCKVLQEGAEAAASSLRHCAGLAGYALETSETGPRQYLAVVTPDGQRSKLDLSGIAANGSLGKVAEWRGAQAGRPRTLIVRVTDPTKEVPTSSLIVARLDAPCIVAVIARGPGQNEKARAVADRKQLACATP